MHTGFFVQRCAHPFEMLGPHVRIPARIYCTNPAQIEGMREVTPLRAQSIRLLTIMSYR